MAASNVRAGRAFIELALKDDVSQHLKRIQARFKSFGEGVKQIGAALATAGTIGTTIMGAAVAAFNGYGSAINDASQRTGVGAEALQELNFAAEQSGASAEALETGLKHLAKTTQDAAGGSKEATDALADLGVTVNDLKGLSPDQQFKRIATAISQIQDPSARTAAAMKVLGRSGTDLLPMMMDGAKGLDAAGKRARELGIVMSADAVAAADAFGDSLGELWAQVRAVTVEIGGAVAGAITPYLESLKGAISTVIGFVKEHQTTVVVMASVAVGAVALGGTLVALGVIMTTVAASATAMTAAIAIAGGAFAVITSPITGVVAALGLASAGVYLLVKNFDTVKAIGLDAFGKIKGVIETVESSLANGWTSAIQIVSSAWSAFSVSTQKIWEEIQHAMQVAWEYAKGVFTGGADDGALAIEDRRHADKMAALDAEHAKSIADASTAGNAAREMELRAHAENMKRIAEEAEARRKANEPPAQPSAPKTPPTADEIAKATAAAKIMNDAAINFQYGIGPVADKVKETFAKIGERIDTFKTASAVSADSQEGINIVYARLQQATGGGKDASLDTQKQSLNELRNVNRNLRRAPTLGEARI